VYRPLPDSLTIMPSKIEGLGLFTKAHIEKGVNLGITHVTDPMTMQLYRTPLGGFINHSDTPNAKIVEVQRYRYLYILQDLDPLQEITVKYTMYKIEGDNNEYERRDTTAT